MVFKRNLESESSVGRCMRQKAGQVLRMFIDRHDDEDEKQRDEVRQEIRNQHRFNSFAGERADNMVKW